MVFTRFSAQIHSRSHSRTDRPEYTMPPAPFVNHGGGIRTFVIACVKEVMFSLVTCVRLFEPYTLVDYNYEMNHFNFEVAFGLSTTRL